jgi:peptide/nickel transport system substrate-binding protein
VPDHPHPNELTRRLLLQRGAVAGAALSPLAAFLAACGDSDPSGTTTGSGAKASNAEVAEVTWALPFAAQSLDVVKVFDDATVHCLSNVLGGLLVFDDKLELQPNLAESWEQPDELTYRYTLREGLKFSDGSPLTSEDVVYSMKRSSGPKSTLVTFYGKVKSIEAEDERTVVVRMREPDALFKNVPAHPAGWVVSKRFAEQAGSKLGQAKTLTLGAGPYVVSRFVPSDLVELERNPHWWGPKAAVARISIKFITTNSTRLLAVRDGSVDGTFQVPLEEARSWEGLRDASIVEAPGIYFAGIAFNTRLAPFDDVHVRRAVAYATNNDGIVEGLLGGHAETAIGGCAAMPPLWGGNGLSPDESRSRMREQLKQYPFDLDAARRELAQSKVPDGFSFRLDYPDSYARLGRAFQVMKQDLSQLGIDLTVGEVPFNKYIAGVFNHEIPPALAILGIADYPDPMNLLYLLFWSEFARANAFNLANYDNPEVDRLFVENLASTDDAKRADLAMEAAALVSEDMPVNALWWENSLAAVNNKYVLEGFNGFYFLQPWGTHIKAAA